MRNGLKIRFFCFFTALGILVALGAGLVMYTRYIASIKNNYRKTLSQVAAYIEKQFPLMSDPEAVMREGLAQSDVYYQLTGDMNTIAETFGLTYIYLIIRIQGEYRFILDSTASPEVFRGLAPEDYFLPYEPAGDMLAAEQTRTLQVSKKPFTDEYGVFVSATLPVIKNGEVRGFIGADYEVSLIRSLEWNARLSLLLALAAAIVLSAPIALAVSSSLIRPIQGAIGALETIARGDLTAPIVSARDDELGDLTRLLAAMQEKIRALIIAIRDKAALLAAVDKELMETMGESAGAVGRIKTGADAVREQALTQTAGVTKANTSMARIIGNIDALNANIEAQAESVSQSSQAVERMAASIAGVTRSLIENEGNINKLTAASERGHGALRQVSGEIQNVVAESERLLEINKVIQHIASQTNLLAMNAAIEAAHAGAVGRGFAVVADEIRKLAESSSGQAKMVSAVLKSITGSLSGIGGSTSQALSNFEDIDREMKIVADQETRIRLAVEEQDTGSRAILELIDRSNGITRNVRQGSEEMFANSSGVASEGKSLEVITRDLSEGMEGIAAEMGSISAAVNRVRDIGLENSRGVDALIQEISKFKVD
ncbi:MAG: methyl-accepting chemotaxis protein [Treponema sp.]|jgi:methyl-accepting chemotaxis protein|nr:methyl-accepting chemotaxis protein [Treponema sp.]